MWPQWAAAAKQFAAEGTLRKQHRTKKVVLMSDCYVQLFLLYPFVYCFATSYMVRQKRHDKERCSFFPCRECESKKSRRPDQR